MTSTLKSKLYFPPSKKDRALSVVLNICVIIIAVCFLFSVINSGPKIGNISGIIVAIAASIGLSRKSNMKPHYEFCYAKVTVSENNLLISYESFHQLVQFMPNDIRSFEYSDQLQCLKISGPCTVIKNDREKDCQQEWLLYVERVDGHELFDLLQNTYKKQIKYMDEKVVV